MAHPLVKQLIHGGFPHAEGHDIVGHDDFTGEFPEVGLHMAAEHGLHLMGRARQHQHMDAAALKGAAGGGAHRVVKHRAPLRQFRLLGVVLRHGHVERGLVKGADILQNVPVQDQRLPEGPADGLLSEIIVGRAQAPGGDDDVRPAAGGIQGLLQPLRVVTHHGVPKDVDAQCRQALGEHLGVGVGNVAQQQFRAYGDNLGGMGHMHHIPS